VCEQAGVPASSLVCEGFIGQAAATTIGLGMKLPVAFVPGHTGAQSAEVLRRNILDVTLKDVIANLTGEQAGGTDIAEPGARDIVCRGTFTEVNRTFIEREWSDGLPVVPPTRERVDEFLRHTERDADEVLGVILPDSRAATVWSIAVNGVMAGCRPEYMPILVALVEAMCDPAYGVEHSGNTPGGETLIILNGPIIQRLGFNYTQGVLRDGFQPNTSVGRFWRLYLRNVAGFLLHKNDKATFGNTWRVVLAENEGVLANIGWKPTSVEMGFEAGDDTVTIARYPGGNLIANVSGSTPEEILPYLADSLQRQISWQLTFTTGSFAGTLRPLVVLSPIVAETLAGAGVSKRDIKRYLFDHGRIPAWQYERQLRDWNCKPLWNLHEDVKNGRAPKVFAESDDPNRMVPVVAKAEDIMIVVSGDPLRTNTYFFSHNGILGYPVGKKINSPSR
jgi:hypothetical protein